MNLWFAELNTMAGIGGTVIFPEINRLENRTSLDLIIDGDENEEFEIYRAADPGDATAGRERVACAWSTPQAWYDYSSGIKGNFSIN